MQPTVYGLMQLSDHQPTAIRGTRARPTRRQLFLANVAELRQPIYCFRFANPTTNGNLLSYCK